MKEITHIAFDMDGVIFSSEEILAPAYQDTIRDYNQKHNANLPVPELEAILHEVGQPVKVIFRNLFGQFGLAEDHLDELNLGVLNALVRRIKNGDGEIFEGIDKVIADLAQRYTIYVASNGRAGYIEAILEHYNLARFFAPALYISPQRPSKGLLLQGYMERDGLSAERLLMIGDRASDYEAARHVGCRFMACTYGHGPEEETAGADFFAPQPQNISEQILNTADN